MVDPLFCNASGYSDVSLLVCVILVLEMCLFCATHDMWTFESGLKERRSLSSHKQITVNYTLSDTWLVAGQLAPDLSWHVAGQLAPDVSWHVAGVLSACRLGLSLITCQRPSSGSHLFDYAF